MRINYRSLRTSPRSKRSNFDGDSISRAIPNSRWDRGACCFARQEAEVNIQGRGVVGENVVINVLSSSAQTRIR